MTAFILIAALMTLAAVLVIAAPLLLKGRRRIVPTVITALLLPCAAAGLYVAWSNWDWRALPTAEAPAPDVAAMVQRLEQKLQADPSNLERWLMLGRSYTMMERFDDSASAYARAARLSNGENAEALLGEGEAMALGAGGDVTPPAAEIFEQALKLQPQNPKALLFGGFAAASRGDKALARSRWTALKAMNPPPQIAQMLDAHLASLETQPAAGSAAAASGAGRAASSAPSVAPPGAEARIDLKISPALKPRLKEGTALFVFAREPGIPGPPLAVKRLTTAALGSQVTLTSADAMMPSRALQAGRTVTIIARVSFSGQPLPAAGDLYGEVTYHVGQDGVRGLLIDRVAN